MSPQTRREAPGHRGMKMAATLYTHYAMPTVFVVERDDAWFIVRPQIGYGWNKRQRIPAPSPLALSEVNTSIIIDLAHLIGDESSSLLGK